MKTFTTLCLALLTATAAFAADVLPAFNATLTVGKETRFVLIGPDSKPSSWLQIGDTFDGYQLKSYDAKDGVLQLEKDGKVSQVTLAADAKVASGAATAPTIADATAVLDSMHFETMLDQTLAGVRKNQAAMVRQMMARMPVKNANREDIIAFQQKVMDAMMSGITAADMKQDVAKAYTEVFSKDELDGLAAFYSTPVGQTLAEKTPELTQKMNEIIMPRMLANMPKVQQMAQEFAMQERAKEQAAAAPATPAPAPAPAPAADNAPKP